MKEPKQARSKAMVEAIIESATRILCDDDSKIFTTNTVADKAGVSVGSLYQYFSNKEAILSEIGRRHRQQLIKTIRRSDSDATGTTIGESVRIYVRSHIQARLINPNLYKALYSRMNEKEWSSWTSSYRAEMMKSLTNHLQLRPRTTSVKNLNIVAFILFNAVDGAISMALREQLENLQNGAIEAELTRLVTAYLVDLTGHPAEAPKPI